MKLNIPNNIYKKLKRLFMELTQITSNGPSYRVVEILQEEPDDYTVAIQVINKNVIFKMKPEEILATNSLVDQFSQRDIRTLTYLGYLGVNSPKYKILAKHLSENDEKLKFIIKQKGNKKVFVKTAEEIIKEKEILSSLDQQDSHLVGYTAASESIIEEKKHKEEALKRFYQLSSEESKIKN